MSRSISKRARRWCPVAHRTPRARPTIDVESFQAGEEEPLRLELDAFIHAVASGSRPVVSGEDGEAALNLATLVLEAIGQFTQRHQAGRASEPGLAPENVCKGISSLSARMKRATCHAS